jgi:hypothetical protein
MSRRPCGAKPHVKGAQGSADRLHFESIQAETWRLCSHVSSQEYPMSESRWKPGRAAGWPREWLPDCPSPPNRLN